MLGRGKAPRKLWKIGEIALHTGVSRQTIHNYTVMGLITEELRTPSGHRLYGEQVFRELERIERLKTKGMTLGEIARRAAARRSNRDD